MIFNVQITFYPKKGACSEPLKTLSDSHVLTLEFESKQAWF